MIPYLTIALAVCSLFAIGYMNFVRPARRRRRAAMEIAPPEPRPNFAPNKPTGVTPPDGRVPRDLDRPYPRPAGGRRKPDKTCPVCGTGAETTPLDGKVLGWRAHGSCAEWLGEWQPTGRLPVPLPYSPDKSLIGYMEKGQKGERSIAVSGNLTGIASTGDGAVNLGGTAITIGAGTASEAVLAWLANGWRTAADPAQREVAFDALKTALDGDTFTRRACPDCGMEFAGTADAIDTSLYAHRKGGQCDQRRNNRDAIEQRRKPPDKPVITEYCTCGTKFTGTAEWIRMRLDVHRASGACPHSVKGRAADLRDLEGR